MWRRGREEISLGISTVTTTTTKRDSPTTGGKPGRRYKERVSKYSSKRRDLGQKRGGLISTVTEIVEVVTTMLNEIRQTITEWIHSIQLQDITEEGVLRAVPELPRIDTQKVPRIRFRNAHRAHPTDAHDKWVETMENAEALQIGAFSLSESSTNVQLPLYKRLVKARTNGGYLVHT